MPEFRFSDAAQLYATNAAVVDLMRKAMKRDVADLLDRLCDDVQQRIAPRALSKWRNKHNGDRSWRITKRPGAARENVLIGFYGEAPETVVPGELSFSIGSQESNLTDKIKERIHSLSKDPELAQYCQTISDNHWALLAGKIPYRNKNPIEAAGPVIASYLLKIAAASEDP